MLRDESVTLLLEGPLRKLEDLLHSSVLRQKLFFLLKLNLCSEIGIVSISLARISKRVACFGAVAFISERDADMEHQECDENAVRCGISCNKENSAA